MSIQKPHASGKQHAFPLSSVCEGSLLILEQAVDLNPSCWFHELGLSRACAPLPRTGPRASSFNRRDLTREAGSGDSALLG